MINKFKLHGGYFVDREDNLIYFFDPSNNVVKPVGFGNHSNISPVNSGVVSGDSYQEFKQTLIDQKKLFNRDDLGTFRNDGLSIHMNKRSSPPFDPRLPESKGPLLNQHQIAQNKKPPRGDGRKVILDSRFDTYGKPLQEKLTYTAGANEGRTTSTKTVGKGPTFNTPGNQNVLKKERVEFDDEGNFKRLNKRISGEIKE